jgi:hypothetical protein
VHNRGSPRNRADRRVALAGRVDLRLLLLAGLTMAVARYL